MRTATVTINGEKSLADNSQPDLYYTYVQPNYFPDVEYPAQPGHRVYGSARTAGCGGDPK